MIDELFCHELGPGIVIAHEQLNLEKFIGILMMWQVFALF